MNKTEQIEKMAMDLYVSYTEFTNSFGETYMDYVETVRNMFDKGYRKLPTGEWIIEREPNGMIYCFSCSFCYEESETMTNFCPHCGAKMDYKERQL